MVKKYLFTVLLSFSMFTAMAQSSMTDEQVIKFVLKEQKAGSTQQEIAVKLVQNGVTPEQIKRVQRKAERLKKNQGLGATNKGLTDEEAEGRSRTNTGNLRKSELETTGKLKDEKPWRKNTQNGTRQIEDDEDVVGIKDNLDEFMPDSFGIYERQVIRDYLKAKEEREKKKSKIFGHDLFNNEDLTFEPAMNIATPTNYILGGGDKIFIDIYGASQKTIEETVSPDGFVVVEDYGPVQVGGLTVEEANRRVKSQLGARFSGSDVQLSLGQTRSITINVMGEVNTPGSYTLSSLATVFHALYMAGGPNDIGTLRNIRVYRSSRLISTVDIYDYILNGKLAGNVRLADNDVIIVGAYEGLVNVTGKVKRPMIYEMKNSESLKSLIDYAGGFTGDAYRKSVRVIRKEGTQYSVHTVGEFDMSAFRMSDQDSVDVDSIIPRFSNMVEIKGAVFRPGMYQLGDQVTTVKTLLEAAEGVTEEAFTAHGVMHRMKADRTLEVLSVDVEGIMNGTAEDIILKNEDALFIPSKQEVMAEQTITIHGEVQYPGVYKYADNETLEDFVLQAGGLKETAAMVNVFVSRRIVNPMATSTDSILGESFNFTLKDGFVIDGESGFHLKPFDEVFIRQSPGYKRQKNVSIEGEVLFGGEYSLTKQNERLSDLVKKAGGLTDVAYVAGARLERKLNEAERLRYEESIKMQQKQDEAVMLEQIIKSGRSAGDISAGMRTSTQSKQQIPEIYQVGIELDKAIAKPGGDADIILREGDRLIVPQYPGTVKISGEVLYPNTVGFQAGKKAKYYINQAGGFSSKAKKRKAYIIYMNGDVAKVSSGAKVRPGCEIVVPQKAINKMTVAETAALGTSVASIATMLATLANILSK